MSNKKYLKLYFIFSYLICLEEESDKFLYHSLHKRAITYLLLTRCNLKLAEKTNYRLFLGRFLLPEYGLRLLSECELGRCLKPLFIGFLEYK